MHRYLNVFTTLALLFLLAPLTAVAATISLHAFPSTVGVGDTVRVDVVLDSTDATNAFSGTVVYSPTLEPIAISDGNSIIGLWMTHPDVPARGASIPFTGITPGGFSGQNGMLFSILFRARGTGFARVSLAGVQVLRNDGAGGQEPVTEEPALFSITATGSGGYAEPHDSTPPEPFTAYLGADPGLFGGRAYLVFAAVDKQSGIDHYEIAESRFPEFMLPLFPPSWSAATSPYVLSDQSLTSTVYLQAVDRAGNVRNAVFPPKHSLVVYEGALLLAILMAVALLLQRGQGRRFGNNP